jgi:uncharacterized protein (DUF362 family)
MAVLVSNGRNKLLDSIHLILDTFLTDADYTRGIFIKPNIVFPVKPRSGEITSPVLVKTLISAIRERHHNTVITLGEGVAAGCDPLENFEISGFTRLAHELDVPLLDLHKVERKTISWKFGKLVLPSIAFDNTFINLPILKYSSACTISGALKNQKGLVLPAMKKHFHRLGLHEQIAELNMIIQPTLTIMDCSTFFGHGVLISGNNCGEIDASACNFLGIEEPEHVQLSRNAGVFALGYTIKGDKINIKSISARPKVKEFKRLARLRLWSNPQACTMCRYLFYNIQHNFLNRQNLIIGAKFLAHSIKGAEIIMGSNPQWQKEYESVICIGACTYRIAKENGYIYIPGCPPTLDDLRKYLP